jgi:hypothetical protein
VPFADEAVITLTFGFKIKKYRFNKKVFDFYIRVAFECLKTFRAVF